MLLTLLQSQGVTPPEPPAPGGGPGRKFRLLEPRLVIDDDDHTDELATALVAWLAAMGSAHAAITQCSIEGSLTHLLPDRPVF